LSVTAAVLLVIAGYGIIRLREKPGDTIPLTTVMVQQNVPQAVKWAGAKTTELYQQLADLTRLNAEKRDGSPSVDLVIWPESAVPVPLFAHADHPQYFNGILSLGDFSLLTGAEIQEPNEPMYTSAVLMRGTFENQQHYHKVHLVPFGEFLPFRDTFPFSLLKGVLPGDFVPGESTEPLYLEKSAVGIIPLICFEDTVGRLARKFVRDEPQLIVNLTNDGWFLQSAETEIHTANSIFRAIELRRPMARAANTGITCVIDDRGRMIAKLKDPATGDTFIEGVLQSEINIPKNPPLTLYARFGDWFSVTMLALCASVFVRRWRARGA
jgi:apolipoprotein N-acyltransferase